MTLGHWNNQRPEKKLVRTNYSSIKCWGRVQNGANSPRCFLTCKIPYLAGALSDFHFFFKDKSNLTKKYKIFQKFKNVCHLIFFLKFYFYSRIDINQSFSLFLRNNLFNLVKLTEKIDIQDQRPKICLNVAVHKHKQSNMCLCLCFSGCV